MTGRTRVGWIIIACAVAGCSTWHAQPLPSPVSLPPRATGTFRAGFAQVDLTPPPSVGMGGSGPEGRRSTGYRTRLHAAAMVLEDAGGERVAFVVADLPHISANIHRLVAARLIDTLGIGADRLIISATHTHSGPSHFYGERQYNASASRVGGYDPRLTDLIVSRITNAVTEAATRSRPAVVGHGRIEVEGATWNRSLEAHCLNPESNPAACKQGDTKVAIDRSLFMLRVDELVGDRRLPMGSYSVLPLHGTSLPSLNTLLDGDAHVRIVERLAARVREQSGGRATVHLLANGAEGDVAPDIKREGCALPKPGLFDAVPAPRGPGELVDFIEPSPELVRHCVAHGVEEVERIAAIVADHATRLYQELEGGLGAPKEIRRAFTTEWLPGHDGLCSTPEVGSSTAAGADSLVTRVRGWRWLLPFVPLGLEEGKSAIDRKNRGCHGPKRTLLGAIQALAVVGEHGLPETAQLAVVRIDSLLLGVVPAEVTTVAGSRMRLSMARAFEHAGRRVSDTVLVGLANGFLQYVTTAEEYELQHYEGGSNLYGPGTAGFLGRRLAELARRISPTTGPSPPAQVGPITAYPGPPEQIMAHPRPGPAEPIIEGITVTCDASGFMAEWVDLAPGRMFPRDSTTWVVIERVDPAGPPIEVARDGDGRLEISSVRPHGETRFEWRARWRPGKEQGRFAFVRLGERPAERRTSAPASCPTTESGE